MSQFWEDLQLGHRAEEYVRRICGDEFPTLKRVVGENPDYDLITDDGYTIEVKWDLRSRETGNVAIEYKHRNKPSGITTSKAIEWFIFYYNKFDRKWRYLRIKRVDLLAYLRNNWKYLSFFVGGDSNKSDIILIPVRDLEREFVCRDLPELDN